MVGVSGSACSCSAPPDTRSSPDAEVASEATVVTTAAAPPAAAFPREEVGFLPAAAVLSLRLDEIRGAAPPLVAGLTRGGEIDVFTRESDAAVGLLSLSAAEPLIVGFFGTGGCS